MASGSFSSNGCDEALNRQNALLMGINRILFEAITCESEERLGMLCLEVAETVTQSKFGFIGEINPQTGRLDDIAISDPGWEACRMGTQPPRHGTRSGIYGSRVVPGGFQIQGIYGRVLLDCKGFFTNDPENHPDRIGTPSGHPPLKSFLGVPLFYSGKLFGMIGLGNREGGYNAQVLADVEALGPTIGQILINKRAEINLRKNEADLLEKEARLRYQANLLASVYNPVMAMDSQLRITYWNKAAEETFGWTEVEVLGKYSKDVLQGVFPNTTRDDAVKQLLDSGFYDDEAFYRHKDGHFIAAQVSSKVLKDENGEFIGVVATIKDISERKKMEQALADSERRYRELVQFAPSAFYEIDFRTGRFISVNDSMVELSGYSREELLQMTGFDLLDEDGKARFKERVRKWLAGSPPDQNVEYRVKAKDGRIIYAILNVTFTRDENGQPVGAAVVGHDITERKKMEQALRESELIYRAIGESIDYGIWICAPDGRNIYASQSLLDLVGITQQECSDFGWGNSLHPDDSERTIQAWKECVRTEGVWDIEHRYMGRDGEYHPILARGIPVRNANGEIFCWAGINLDIGRLKRTEQALRDSEEHFRVALKNSPVVVYTCDRDLRYTWVYNPALGFKASQMIGKTDEEINRPEAVTELVALKRSVLESGIGKRQEIQLKFQENTFYYDVTAEPVQDEHGKVSGLTVAAIDITQEKLLEQARMQDQLQIELQRRLMEQREKDRQALARDIHDGPVQTLSSTLFNIQFAKEAFSDPLLRAELEQIALNLKSAIQELRQVIYELRPPSVIRFGLARAIRFHAEDLHEKYPEMSLNLRMETTGEELSELTCLTLYRVYQEAITNIVRHSGASKVWIRLSNKGGDLVLQIRDNGVGMPEESNIDGFTKNGHYGLAGIKERVDALDGKMTLISKPGRGTTLRVSISTQEANNKT